MGKWNPINIAKEFAKGTTVTGYGGEEFGEVRGMPKKKMQKELKRRGNFDDTQTIKSRGGKKKR